LSVNDTLTAVPGLQVGHWTSQAGTTGCTVILGPPEGMLAAGLVLGGAPAVRETALLDPAMMMNRVDAVLLTGGSAFGLAAADGVMRWLVEQGRGFETMAGRVPIVPAAAIFDLALPGAGERPDGVSGYEAARAASCAPVAGGLVGAGAGATAGSYLGFDRAVRTGLGSAAVRLEDAGVTVAALAVANPAGDVIDHRTARLVAGQGLTARELAPLLGGYRPQQNTTLVVVATDALISKATASALAVSAHAGLARSIRPSHTPFDGDTAFVVSTGLAGEVPVGPLAVLVQEVVSEAILLAGTAKS
jgi:L-aminopeptidase/D-esterase-like protein